MTLNVQSIYTVQYDIHPIVFDLGFYVGCDKGYRKIAISTVTKRICRAIAVIRA